MVRVLCIEDETELRCAIAEELRDEGFQVFEAGNGREGLEAIMYRQPDVVLCDVMMPGMTGIQVLESIREMEFQPCMPFIFMSAVTDKEHIIAAKRLGADDYVQKPVDFEILTATIRSRLACNARIISAVAGEETRSEIDEEIGESKMHGLCHDPVTGLSTQRSLHIFLVDRSSAADGSVPHWAITIDIANLAEINAQHGFAAGNDIVRHVGHRIGVTLSRILPDTETGESNFSVARLPGGNFGVVILGEDTRDGIECVAKEVVHDLAVHTFGADNREVPVRVRMGACEGHSTDVRASLRSAGRALRSAKHSGESLISFFDRASDTVDGDSRHSQLLTDLPRALRDGEMELYFQPRMNFSNARVDSLEALLRWSHPILGLVTPDQFIPLAEETGLIVDIGEWALVEACKQAKAWTDGNFLDLRVAVNISPVHFAQRRFVGRVAEILRETDLPARHLEIEITESTYLMTDEATKMNVEELRELGVAVAIDDFGTGFANLAYMKNLSTDTVKIDRVFVKNIVDDHFDLTVAESILKLGSLRKMKVVAEGVESVEQVEFLRKLGCTEFQGYLYSPPVSAGKIPRIVQDLTAAFPAEEDQPSLRLADCR